MPILLPLISLAVTYAPSLIGLFMGDKASAAANKVVEVAKQVFGTDDPVVAQEKINADPSLGETFAARLNAETEQLRIEMADVANARSMGVQLVQSHHWTANMPAIIVLLLITGYFAFTAALFLIDVELKQTMFQLIMFAYGTMSTAFGGGVQYYLGTTRQNAQKDEQNTALATALNRQPPTKAP